MNRDLQESRGVHALDVTSIRTWRRGWRSGHEELTSD